MIPPLVLTVLDRILEALPVLAIAAAGWAHWRADHAEARLAETRLELVALIETLGESDDPAEIAELVAAEFPDYTAGSFGDARDDRRSWGARS